MAEVVGVVHLRAGEGKADELLAALTTAVEKTHEEAGCLTYALHRDNADPSHIVMVERWASQEDLDAHMGQPYLADLFAVVGEPGMLAGPPELYFVSAVPVGDPAKGSLG